MMIIKPKVRGFLCVTAHPEGCTAQVEEQIALVRKRGPVAGGPRRILVVGASTGYGLSSRIVGAFGCGASTLGVFYERPGAPDKPASAGWYNSAAFERAARAAGLSSHSLNGDAFGDTLKEEAVAWITEQWGGLDLLIYSLASPRRTDPETGQVYSSVLKTIGRSYSSKTVDTDRRVVTQVTVDPAEPFEIEETIKVMGGEDWARWVNALEQARLLQPGFTTVAYDYVGPRLTWPIYKEGSIGRAKQHLLATSRQLHARLQALGGRAYLSVNKAVVTQASSAIPVVPLYIAVLFKVMKERGVHEGCIEQIDRLFREQLYGACRPQLDEEARLRVDDREMLPEVQAAVEEVWDKITTENFEQLTDFAGYQSDFLKLFGFGLPGIDYDAEVEPVVDLT